MDLAALFRSRWYHPSLNQGLFDGPLRLYFHPKDEGLALRIYFRLVSELNAWRDNHPQWQWPEGEFFLVFLMPQEVGEKALQSLEFTWGQLVLLPVVEEEAQLIRWVTSEFYNGLWGHTTEVGMNVYSKTYATI